MVCSQNVQNILAFRNLLVLFLFKKKTDLFGHYTLFFELASEPEALANLVFKWRDTVLA